VVTKYKPGWQGGDGVVFHGTKGWIGNVSFAFAASDEDLWVVKFKDSEERLPVSNEQHRNFIDCVRSRQQPICPVEMAMRPQTTAAIWLSAGLLLLLGCERTPGTGETKPTKASPGQNASLSPNAPGAPTNMVRISGGRFQMGDNQEVDAKPHLIVVSAFLMDQTLVTQDRYDKTMGENPSRWKEGRNPVEQVRWSDAVRFCNKRSELEGLRPCYDLKTWQCDFDADGYRLPTEAEWEYACRAGTSTAYFFGNDPSKLSGYGWFDKNSGGHPRPVGEKQPNAWGLFDMCGNLWEWCNDFYGVDYYNASPLTNPKGPDTGRTKVVRGGAWRFSAERCRSGYRYNENPGYADVCFGYDVYGFRCVRKASGRSN
jgi:formylglycine-generating enzyme required for sulfatase activity